MSRTNDNRLILKRNKKIRERFDFLYQKKRMRYDDVLEKLSEEEFFLSQRRIMEILRTTKIEKMVEAPKRINHRELLPKSKPNQLKLNL